MTAFEVNKKRREQRGGSDELTNNDLAIAFLQGVVAFAPVALLVWWALQ